MRQHRRRPLAVTAALFVLALLAVACTPAADPEASADATPSASTAAAAAARPAPSAAPTTSVGVPSEAADSIGDELFPGLGNGGYDVTHYDLDLRVEPATSSREAPTLDATATITAEAATTLDRINLDLVGFGLDEVTVDGTAATADREGNDLVIVPAEPIATDQRFEVSVAYRGAAEVLESPNPVGGVGWRTTTDVVNYVGAEPDGARTWFPSNDHPLDKATFRTTVTVPRALTAAANGALVETVDDGDTTTFVWSMDQPMAPYLATVVIGDMRIVEDGTAGDGGRVAIRHLLPADEADDPPVDLDRVDEMIAFFEQRFGPFPFETYGFAVIDGFQGGLETQTLTLIGRPPGGDRLNEKLMAHEVAHEWFGNSVSLERWDDLWLKEGFAVYAAWMWMAEEHEAGKTVQAEARDAHAFLAEEDEPPTAELNTETLYSWAPYDGGALTLHALRAEVGDDAFFEITRTFATTYGYGNADTDDFIAVAEHVAGRDLDDLFDAWLHQQQRPPLPKQ